MLGKKVKFILLAFVATMSLFFATNTTHAAGNYYQTYSYSSHKYIVVKIKSNYYQKHVIKYCSGYKFHLVYTYYCGVPVKVCVISCCKVTYPKQPSHEVEIEDNNSHSSNPNHEVEIEDTHN